MFEYFEIGPFSFSYETDEKQLIATEGDWEVWVAHSDDLEKAKVAAARWAMLHFSAWIQDALSLVT